MYSTIVYFLDMQIKTLTIKSNSLKKPPKLTRENLSFAVQTMQTYQKNLPDEKTVFKFFPFLTWKGCLTCMNSSIVV